MTSSDEEVEIKKIKIPKYIKIKGEIFSLKKLGWGLFYVSFVFGLIALICIILYVQIYIYSFSFRVDCNPDLPLNYIKCQDRGCIWVQRTETFQPLCFFPEGYGYKFNEIRKSSNGYHVDLERTVETQMFGNEIDSVSLQVYFETENRLRLKFVDKKQKRFEVPLDVPLPPAESPEIFNYDVSFVNDPQFGIIIRRNSTGNIIFDTNLPGMILSDQYNQISVKLPSTNVYGFGEHSSLNYKQNMNWKNLSLFARDIGTDSSSNLYGSHPFFMNLENNGDAFGVFLLNSNALEVALQPVPAITFRTIGGILDFYIFLGPTPEDVIKQYFQIIGLPSMPPYWALGFHLSRWGYETLNDLKVVAQRNFAANIPIDVLHLDIDYMDNYKDFTYDQDKFKNLPAYIADLHNEGRKVIIILDPAIACNKTLESFYPPLDIGLKRNIFIKINDSNFVGLVWPGKTYFPDFSHPGTKSYWTMMCTEFRKIIRFDGLWLDMNEPSNFNDFGPPNCAKNSLNYPPYAAGVLGSESDRRLFMKTLCMDADQYAGKHYDMHNLYGHLQSNVTFSALAMLIPGKRPMILSRSTFPGSGRYTAHWLGDNFSTWKDLQASIPGILKFNLFGIPFVGADICGFALNATEELCLRWMQLGAFYPFSRNHNSMYSMDQDPANFGKGFIKLVKRALFTRYELLPYLYTLFYIAHTTGGTVARPLLHEFPEDPVTWNIDYQFLWGSALLISPIVQKGATSVEAYFPEGMWYDFYKGSIITRNSGSLLLSDNGFINLHVRGGYIIPLQKPNITTELSRQGAMGLFVAPNMNSTAKGVLFWDDGTSYDVPENSLLLEFRYYQDINKNILSSTIKRNNFPQSEKLHFGYITLCNQLEPSYISLNGETLNSSYWEYNSKTQVLHLNDLTLVVNINFELIIM